MGEHTKRSASSAERWMNCEGSAALDEIFGLSNEEIESEFSAEGIAAHEAAAYCLTNGLATWEIVGMEFNKYVVTPEMADHIRMYVDHVIANTSNNRVIERRIMDSTIHPEFGGTTDVSDFDVNVLSILDLKYGAGIAKDAVGNPQLMYYAYGELRRLLKENPALVPKDVAIVMRIIQPRAFHLDGPIREWIIDGEELLEWGRTRLVGAMYRSDTPGDYSLTPGSWCRFCPARLHCPGVTGAFAAMIRGSLEDARALTDAELGLEKEAIEVVKMRIKALEDETFKRLTAGKKVPGWALGPKKSDRIFKESLPSLEGNDKRVKLEDAMIATFGDKAYAERKFLTPPGVEKLPQGKDFVTMWAYKPDNGLTVVPDDGSKSTVKVLPIEERYASILKSK